MSKIDDLQKLAAGMKEYAESSDYVVGFYVCGSYSKGMIHERSDLDPVFITEEGKKQSVVEQLKANFDLQNCDLCVYTMSEFEELSTKGTSDMGSDRYDYAHLNIAIDKTDGHIQKVIDQRGTLSDEERLFLGAGYLDGYINCFYRSLKAARENWQLSRHLEASDSIHLGLSFLFAVDYRIMPFSKYLEWELNTYPLSFPMEPQDLISKIQRILSIADTETQISLFEAITNYARKTGFKHIVDDWDQKPEELAKEFQKSE